jgi:hypothetical protein
VSTTRRCVGLAAVILTAAGAGASPAAAQEPVIAPGQPLTAKARLSDESTLSRFAYARVGAPIRARASTLGRRVGRLRFQTEDGFAEPYLALRADVDATGREWVQVRVPGRPNGRTGWVVRGALARFHIVRTHLRISRSALTATLYRDGAPIWSTRVGVGTRRTPTPTGHYLVREQFRIAKKGGIYGPYAFGTSAYSVLSDWPRGGVVGIHGTNQPGLIPGRPSHGCVRMRNASILRLSQLMPVGTTVEIV